MPSSRRKSSKSNRRKAAKLLKKLRKVASGLAYVAAIMVSARAITECVIWFFDLVHHLN